MHFTRLRSWRYLRADHVSKDTTDLGRAKLPYHGDFTTDSKTASLFLRTRRQAILKKSLINWMLLGRGNWIREAWVQAEPKRCLHWRLFWNYRLFILVYFIIGTLGLLWRYRGTLLARWKLKEKTSLRLIQEVFLTSLQTAPQRRPSCCRAKRLFYLD
jgi:hypothetical protein